MSACAGRQTGVPPTVCDQCAARRLSVCASLADEGLARLAAVAETVTLSTGQTLVSDGDPARYMFNITRGSLRLHRLLGDGRRQIVGFLFQGDLLGLATRAFYQVEAEALEPLTACRFRRSAYDQLCESFPALGKALLERACHDLQAAQDQMVLLGRMTSGERFARFLLDLQARDLRNGGTGVTLRLSMTRADIADFLGLTTETVSRVVTRFRTLGLIALGAKGQITLLQPSALADYASGDRACS